MMRLWYSTKPTEQAVLEGAQNYYEKTGEIPNVVWADSEGGVEFMGQKIKILKKSYKHNYLIGCVDAG
jgi:hypothetical protein